MTLFQFLAASFLAFAVLTGNLSAGIEKDAPQEDDSKIFERLRWAELFKTTAEEYGRYSTQIDLYEKIVEKELSALKSMVGETETRNYQIRFMMLTNMSSAYHFRQMRKEYRRNYEIFIFQLRKIQNFAKTNNRFSGIFKEMLGDLNDIKTRGADLSDSGVDTTSELIGNIEKIDSRISNIQKRIDLVLFPAEQLADSLGKAIEDMDAGTRERIWNYYFQRRRMYIIFFTWDLAINDIKIWWHGIGHSIFQKLPDSHQDLKLISILMGIFVPAFILLGFLGIARLRKAFPNRDPSTDPLLFRAFLTGVPGFILFLASEQIYFPDNVAISGVSIILMVFSMMDLGWAMTRNRYNVSRHFNSPLMQIFLLNSIIMLFQMLDICDFSLALLWPVTLLIFCIPAFTAKCSGLPLLHRFYLHANRICVPLALFFSLTGFVSLSLLLVFVEFVTFVGISFASDLSHFSKKLVPTGHALISGNLLRAFVLGIGVPLIWSATVLASAFFISEQLLATNVFWTFLCTDFDFGWIKGNPVRIASAVFLFFVFKTMIRLLKESPTFTFLRIEDATVHSLRTIFSSIMWGLYLIVMLYLVGVNLTSITVIAGGLSLGIGFGLQNIVNNFMSGLIIIFGGTVRKGDVIQIEGTMAKVLEINVRSTSIQTYDNAIISVPNSDILTSKITNWTRNDPIVKRELKVGVAYGSDVEKVKAILLEVAKNNPRVVRDPAPIVLFKDFGDSTLNFSLFVWLDIDNALQTLSELHFEIDRLFRDADINIAFPQLQIHVTPDSNGKKDKSSHL